MKLIPLGKTGLEVPAVAVGCMRLNVLDKKDAHYHLNRAMELGCNFFDHADIYGAGACEEFFAEVFPMTPALREQIILQSKCGIVPGKMYDFSKEHILSSVDGILSRLKTDYLDLLVLHRPDALVEPEEVAEAFDTLKAAGKVRHFGVSNHNPGQIALLQKYVKEPLAVNQMQFSLTNCSMISSGMEANMPTPGSIDHDGGVLDYCRLNDITIQTWSPFMYGVFEGVFLGNHEKFPKLNETIDEMAAKYQVSSTTIAAAWILRHPAKMQLISGTTKISRLEDVCKAVEVKLTREDWYKLYLAAGNILP